MNSSGAHGTQYSKRELRDCIDFSVSAGPIELNRVTKFEAWVSTDALHKFRGKGPDDGLSALIEGAEGAEVA